MSTDVDAGTASYVDKRRTWRITIETPVDSEATISVHRCAYREFPDGTKLIVDPNIVVFRRMSDIASKAVQGVTGVQLAGMIAAIADQWDKEDIAAKQPVVKGEQEQPSKARKARAKKRKK